ncbi:unnamed protein product, partial [Adineta steineri]
MISRDFYLIFSMEINTLDCAESTNDAQEKKAYSYQLQFAKSLKLSENGIDDQRVTSFTMLQMRQPPAPQPPRRRKRDLYLDPSIFEHVDQQAIAVAESDQTSYTELVDQLTFGLVTDLEKA